MDNSNGLNVLVAPLDWGLGHATRCISIINELINQGCRVYIAAENPVAALLQNEFPAIEIIPLKGYRVKYAAHKRGFALKIVAQIPTIVKSIQQEKKWLNTIVDQYNIDAVISDNRFGLQHKKIPCVYITHQLHIETGFSFTNFIAQKLHYYYINQFNLCWIPDWEGLPNLSGKLAHPKKRPSIPVQYLGSISRFQPINSSIQFDLLILLSGPEPQRTIFENIILAQISGLNFKICLVKGLPNQTGAFPNVSSNVEIHSHLNASLLNQYICSSKIVIARSGYSTVMDLIALKKKAILVPTPGQTEQEYLGKYLMNNKLFLSVEQDQFNIEKAIQLAEDFPFKQMELPENNVQKAVTHLLNVIAYSGEK